MKDADGVWMKEGERTEQESEGRLAVGVHNVVAKWILHPAEMQHRIVMYDMVHKRVIILDSVEGDAGHHRIDVEKNVMEIKKIDGSSDGQ